MNAAAHCLAPLHPTSPSARLLDSLIEQRRLHAVLQPILDLRTRTLRAHEGLIRGPEDGLLRNPDQLFAIARASNRLMALERACRTTILSRFAELRLPGLLFLNIGPGSLEDPHFFNGETETLLRNLHLTPSRVVLELTEHDAVADFDQLQQQLRLLRNLGFRFAIDDLGEGFSNLRMWSEVRPEYVKIDRSLISGIDTDPLKHQFARAIQDIAECNGATVIAEGIETQEELATVRDIGVSLAQGYLIGHPARTPLGTVPEALLSTLKKLPASCTPFAKAGQQATARTLLQKRPCIPPHTLNDEVFELFENDESLDFIPIVSKGLPIGLLHRDDLIRDFSRRFRRELFGRKSCTSFMDCAPLVVEHSTLLSDLSQLISQANGRKLKTGFIITDNGHYIGVGSTRDLMCAMTDMQLRAARYANPLTQLPGNVPIQEHTERLLSLGNPFVAIHADIDSFKPFNDICGYKRGDEVIRMLGDILQEHTDPKADFVGHVGGDDFILLMQSSEWQDMMRIILEDFDTRMQQLLTEEERASGCLEAYDRSGNPARFDYPTLSLGAVPVKPGLYESHHAISSATSGAKCMAKRQAGSCLFIEQRVPATGWRPVSLET